MGGRPPKSVDVLASKGRIHTSKETLERRKEAENAFTINEGLKESDEVKRNPVAHKKFAELKRLYGKIALNSALNNTVINTYCKLYSECRECEADQERLRTDLQEFRIKLENGDISLEDYISKEDKINSMLYRGDNRLMKRRDIMLKIEKESLLTIQSMLRAVPKKPPKDEEEADPMFEVLKRKGYKNA